ncbi:hypothetical protein, partial [Klebsiella pneumoniae]|uniref:hypothetical protein n=1 Tax=Klebsiella pneumoniae TaxID=573 RepID=UPI0025A0A809
ALTEPLRRMQSENMLFPSVENCIRASKHCASFANLLFIISHLTQKVNRSTRKYPAFCASSLALFSQFVR